MIYIGEIPFSSHSSSEGGETLLALMEHPALVSAANSFKAMPERKLAIFEEFASERAIHSKCVYVFQREYATVDPKLVDLVGTDEATTCVGLVIRNRQSGRISVAHMDNPSVVDNGFTQLLSLLSDNELNTELDVHLVGGFEDASPNCVNDRNISAVHANSDGYSLPLCIKIIETLQKRREKFHIQTLFVLRHNTRWDSEGNAYPIFTGFLLETSTGSIIPASFDRTSRFPDEIVRRIRLSASFEDTSWDGKLLDTYDTLTDRFIIAPCSWTMHLIRVAMVLRHCSESEILLTCSTSPLAEGPEFVENERRKWDYIIQHPDWRETFPMRQPRVFERTDGGSWRQC